MKSKNVYIVLTHKHSLKKFSKTEWEVTEYLEAVHQLKPKHYTMSSAIGDYTNRKMVTGSRVGMTEYDKFDEYIRKKYPNEMNQLDTLYGDSRVPAEPVPEVVQDEFGNVREKTVFDQ